MTVRQAYTIMTLCLLAFWSGIGALVGISI